MNSKYFLGMVLICFAFISVGVAQNKSSKSVTKKSEIQTIKIGKQIWTKKNLDIVTYKNGDKIRLCRNTDEWKDAISRKEGACCYYNYEQKNGELFGLIYNWFAISDPRGIAPQGWHLPNDSEWKELIDFLGGKEVAGGKLKEKGTKYWEEPNMDATNQSGFSALAGGYCLSSGFFSAKGSECRFWSSSIVDDNIVVYWYMDSNYNGIIWGNSDKNFGFYVRCVKD